MGAEFDRSFNRDYKGRGRRRCGDEFSTGTVFFFSWLKALYLFVDNMVENAGLSGS